MAHIRGQEWFNTPEEMQARYLENKFIYQFKYQEWQERLAKPLPPTYILIPPEPKRTTMNYSTAVFLINNKVRAVRGTYEPGAATAVFKTLDQTIKKDDLVVVPTNTRHSFTVFKITDVDVDVDMDSGTKMDWVVCKVDLDAHKTTLIQEDDAISKIKSAEMRRKREELTSALFKDDMATMKALPIASMNGDTSAA